MEASVGIHCFVVWLFIVSYCVLAKLYRLILRLTASIFYCCITVSPQTKCLKTIHISLGPMGEESKHSSAGDSVSGFHISAIKVSAVVSAEVPLGKDPLSSSHGGSV